MLAYEDLERTNTFFSHLQGKNDKDLNRPEVRIPTGRDENGRAPKAE